MLAPDPPAFRTVVHWVAACPACDKPASWTQQQPSNGYHPPICQCPCQETP